MISFKWEAEKAKLLEKAAVNRGLFRWAQHVLEESKREVPLRKGTLARSGMATADPVKQEAMVSYDTPYAVVQHEDMTLHHDAGRKAKYLEDPLNASRQAGLKIMADELNRALS